MNIHHLQQAEEGLRQAHFFTVNAQERAEIAEEHERVLLLLRKRGVFMGSIAGTEPTPKADKTSAPICPSCNNTGKNRAGNECICQYGGFHPMPTLPPLPAPIMDEDDLRRDLQRLCQEQREKIETLTNENDSWRADSKALERIHNLLCESMPGFKGCPSPPEWCFAALQKLIEQRDALSSACHRAVVRLESGTIQERETNANLAKDLREILNENEPNFARGVS